MLKIKSFRMHLLLSKAILILGTSDLGLFLLFFYFFFFLFLVWLLFDGISLLIIMLQVQFMWILSKKSDIFVVLLIILNRLVLYWLMYLPAELGFFLLFLELLGSKWWNLIPCTWALAAFLTLAMYFFLDEAIIWIANKCDSTVALPIMGRLRARTIILPDFCACYIARRYLWSRCHTLCIWTWSFCLRSLDTPFLPKSLFWSSIIGWLTAWKLFKKYDKSWECTK